MNFKIKKVATTGCEIKNEKDEVIGWSADKKWGRIMIEAMEMYLKSIGKEAA